MQVQRFKRTELGEIPEEWKIVKLDDVCSIRKKENIQSDYYVGLEHIGQGNNQLIAVENTRNFISTKNSFRKGDVLYGKLRPLLNKVYMASFDGYCSTDILPLVPNESIVSLILLLHLTDQRFVQFADSSSSGTKMPRTNWSDIKNYLLPIGPVKEQQKIASILSNVNNLIQKTDQLIEQTQRLKKGLTQRFLTKGIGHIKFKKTELGEIPEEWSIELLKNHVSKVGSGITPRGGSRVYRNDGIPFIRSQNVHFDGLRLESLVYVSKEIDEQMKNTRIKPLDVLLNITGASIGRCTLVPFTMIHGNVNQHVCIIRPTEKLDPQYLAAYLSSRIIQNLIRSMHHGLSREGLTFSQICMFPIILPSIKEQQKISSILSKVDKLIHKLKEKKKAEEFLKKGLMQQLLSGRKRVRA